MTVSSIFQPSLLLNLIQHRAAYVKVDHTRNSATTAVSPGAVFPVGMPSDIEEVRSKSERCSVVSHQVDCFADVA